MRSHTLFTVMFILLTLNFNCEKVDNETKMTNWFILQSSETENGAHHTKHFDTFGERIKDFNNGINEAILKGIDIVQSHAMDGGKYFIGINAVPTESPVNYNLQLFNKKLLEIPRSSSYCSGSTYAAFIEALNILLMDESERLSEDRFEAMRMQELDGGRREDCIKFWGYWNADGFGNHFALHQYSQMGETISPRDARPGDFMNISWKNGGGHSVIFLGWIVENGENKLMYWSSQTGTNGYGDQIVSLQRIADVKVVRLTKPENIFNFDVNAVVDLKIPGDVIDWN